VGAKVELHPQVRIVAGVPRAAARHRKNPTVVVGVGAKPLLDARELRFGDPLACKDERLEGAPCAIAIAEGVDHHEVEVGHGRLHQRILVLVAGEVQHEFLTRPGTASGTGPV
jgi:hypothetical protein